MSSVLGSLMGSTTGMSAQDRQARENLVTSLVAGIATVSRANAATTVSAGLTEVENNQVVESKRNPLNALKVDLVSRVCGNRTCTDAQIKEILKAQNELQQAVNENAMTTVKVGGAAAAVGGVAIVTPDVASAFSLGTVYDYAGDALSYSMGLSKDAPNLNKSMIVGGLAAAMTPFYLPLGTLGSNTLGKMTVGGYNAIVGGTASFAGTAIANPSGNADMAGALGTTGGAAGQFAEQILPGNMGRLINQFIQFSLGPAQAAIDASKNNSSEK
ncbi:hypothetical protein QS306_08130 [Paraburkholderia bonniea]|uniref:hypothetical protein n=1 Tax=Paraburkholderia bonniea TaxID=2152891 RepID=UPI002573F978|nr:hypothetical protein [Paraburkholderia bonniea]WJF89109.1 hypothetical protein QS306_08130 [Paraburkholderia bonniea]WJF92425.1 hypothetical protein QS308_08140 [Paraburkholderia bonniea]